MAAGGSSWMGYLNMYHDLAYLKLDEALQLAEIGRHSADILLPPFHKAVKSNNFSKVSDILKKGTYDINKQSSEGSTALHIAVDENQLKMVKLLVEKKANLNLRRTEGFTPLHLAVQHKRLAISLFLIRNGADVNAVDDLKWTPLHNVAYNGFSLEVLRELIAKGSNVNARTKEGRNALHLAAEHNFVEVVKILIKNKIDINCKCERNWTPLHSAAYDGSLKVVQILLDHGAAIDAKTVKLTTPLHFAVTNNHLEVVKFLLKRNADINAQDHTFWSSLNFAVDMGNKEMVLLLLKHGVNCNPEKFDRTGNPLQKSISQGNEEIMELLVQYGAKVNVSLDQGPTPLHIAIMYRQLPAVKCLIKYGAYYDAKLSILNEKPIDIAKNFKKMEIVKYFDLIANFFEAIKQNKITDVAKYLMEGAPVNCKSVEFKTALIFACQKGYSDIVDVLLNHNADVNLTNEDNISALHYAAQIGNYTIVGSLLNNGAMFDLVSKSDNTTPLSYAVLSGHKDIIDLLKFIEDIFEDVKNGKLSLITKLEEIKTKNKVWFNILDNVCNKEKKNLVEFCYSCNNKNLCQSLKEIFDKDA